MRKHTLSLLFLCFAVSCAKDVGKRSGPAFQEKSFLDSIQSANYRYFYKNDSVTVLPGSHGPHGPFFLRFNKRAYNALTEMGKLPAGQEMPEGSIVIKELVQQGSAEKIYYYMYKQDKTWLWGKINSSGKILSSIYGDPGGCINCHSQTGHRDFITSFYFY